MVGGPSLGLARPIRALSLLVVLGTLALVFALSLFDSGQARASTAKPRDTPLTFPVPNWIDTTGPIALTSPTVATIDGVEAVVVASENGYLDVVDALTGANLPGWPQPVEFNSTQPTAIESSPTVAYLDGPEQPPTIIIGAGSTYVAKQSGGVIAFREDGTVRFRFDTRDVFNEWTNVPRPDGFSEGVFSTPAVGDITGSGQQDIVFGSWDHELYALTPHGSLVPGFPVDTQDTIWSSPALFHVRGSGTLQDIFVGGDASGRQGCFGGFIYDFSYANGAPHLVWSHCKNQTIWSSPAVGVINNSGKAAVIFGTGFGEVPPYKSDAYKLFAYYANNGARVPGWPVRTAGPAFGSPAIGPITAGTVPLIFDTSWCMSCASAPSTPGSSMVYAWNGRGKRLWSQTLVGANDFASPVLVDLTGSGSNDVLVGSSSGLYALDGTDGHFLFTTAGSNKINGCSAQNAVAVANVPGTGDGSGWHMFEACGGPAEVIATGRLMDYPLPAVPGSDPPWPMWRDNGSHDGVATSTLIALNRRSTGQTHRRSHKAAAVRSSAG